MLPTRSFSRLLVCFGSLLLPLQVHTFQALARSVTLRPPPVYSLTTTHMVQGENGIVHIEDKNHLSVLHNPLDRPVLVDAYTATCGPCKLIERTIRTARTKYADNIDFVKWDAATGKSDSKKFMEMLRNHDMTFNKLPTLILFKDGKPIALRSGMCTEKEMDTFLSDNLDALSPGELSEPKELVVP